MWKTPWTKVYDTSKLVEGANLDNAPLVVDVGGNTGIDISHVLARHPELPAGSLVLQDLPEIIAKAKVDKKITATAHDFFLPQPVKGEREAASLEIVVIMIVNLLRRKPSLLHACRPSRLARRQGEGAVT